MHDATQERFGKTAERIGELQDERAAELEQQVVRFVGPTGDERALDSGTGTGALAFALAPHVREVVALDVVPELLEQARRAGASRTSPSSRATRPACRSATGSSTWPARCARSTTSRGRSWPSRS